MKIILLLLMGFAAAVPVAVTVISIFYFRRKRMELRIKLGTADGSMPYHCPTSSTYIKERIDPSIECYGNKATAFSIYYTGLTLSQIIWSAMIAVVLMVSDQPGDVSRSKIFSAILGAAVTIASGINASCKFKERWLQYLDLRDKLFAERSMFMSAKVYDGLWCCGKNGVRYNFVEKCESIIALEFRHLADNLSAPDGKEPERQQAKTDEQQIISQGH